MSPQSSRDVNRRHRGGLALVGTIGGYVALSILGGLGAGLLLDRILHTGPLFLVIGVLVGFVASFYLTYRVAMGELAD